MCLSYQTIEVSICNVLLMVAITYSKPPIKTEEFNLLSFWIPTYVGNPKNPALSIQASVKPFPQDWFITLPDC